MSISNKASGIRTGVCTSTTRPTAPYNGQVIYETDTGKALVWNNTTWVYLATNTANPVGLEFISATPVGSGVGSTGTVVTGCFSSAYDNYRVIVSGVTFSAANNAVAVRLGSSTTRTDYIWGGYNITLTTGVLAAESANGTAEGLRVGYTSTTATSFAFDLYGPFLAQRTNYYSGFGEGNYVGFHSGYDNSAVSYSDLYFRHGTTTMTGGTIRVYGYKN